MNQNNDIKSLVLEKIKTGKINMRPRFYFILKVVALAVVAILILLVSSLLVSFIIFSLINSGKLFLFGFGARGFLMFFLLFPWPLLILEIALIALLEWLVKKFKFGYLSSFARLILIIFLTSVFIGAVIDVTPFHRNLQYRAEQRNLPLPFVDDFYRGIRRPPPGQEIFRGVVSDVGTSSFTLSQKNDTDTDEVLNQNYVVVLPPGSSHVEMPVTGDMVFVAGRLISSSTVQAYGFQKFSAESAE